MKSNLNAHLPISTKALSDTKQTLQTYVDKKVELLCFENNKKYKTYVGTIISVNTNIFSARVSLGENSGKVVQSFKVCDILTGKIKIELKNEN